MLPDYIIAKCLLLRGEERKGDPWCAVGAIPGEKISNLHGVY